MLVEDFKNDIQKNDGDIKILYKPEDHIILEADKGRLTQVLSNILNNAIKFSKKTGGKISITTTVQQMQNSNKSDEKVLVSIKDNGTGIDSYNNAKVIYKICYKVRIRHWFRTVYIKKYYRSSWWINMGRKQF